MIKKCIKCLIEKPLSEFSFKNKLKQQHSSYCKECHKLYVKQHYQQNKSEYIARSKLSSPILVKQRKQQINNYKHSKGCKYCSENNPVCLDFHHTNPKNRDFKIAKKMYLSFSKLLQEIKKCDVVCSNCHRKIHANQL